MSGKGLEMPKSVTGKRLLFVTGTRADFGKLEPLAKAARDAGFQISFFYHGHAHDGPLRRDPSGG